MRAELGPRKWEAVGHFLSEGDYLAFHQHDYRAAIFEYENAWQLLTTLWQRQTGGVDILKAIADFALLAEDFELAAETIEVLRPRAKLVADAQLSEVCDRLAEAAKQKSRG